jgi:hypothetical protein
LVNSAVEAEKGVSDAGGIAVEVVVVVKWAGRRGPKTTATLEEGSRMDNITI